jgi:hypothetical protein
MPRSPARPLTSTVASPPDTEILPAISGKAAPPRRSRLSASRCETTRAGDAVVLALRFAVLKGVIDEIADR